jgi:hypothetical protein
MRAVLRRSVGVVAVALLAAACTSGGPAAKGSTTTAAPSGPVLVVDQAVTPKGWVPVDYGDVQVSVPASWSFDVEEALCDPGPPGVVEVGPVSGAPGCGGAPSIEPESTATVLPLTGPGRLSGRSTKVNGVPVIVAGSGPGSAAYFIPSLDADVNVTGSLGRRVLATLTYSPRAAVLSGEPLPTVPSSWHRVSFAGLSFATPASWPNYTTDWYRASCVMPPTSYAAPAEVNLSTDTVLPVVPCDAPTFIRKVQTIGDGVEVDEIPSRAPATPTGLSTNCFHPHGLTACPYAQPAFGILYLLATGPGLAHGGVMFEVGLAGSGAVARTIIGSLRAA